jgi:glutaredoxin 3
MKQISKIQMVKKDPCPYCDRALRFLQNKGVEFEVIDLTNKLDEIQEWKNKTGWSTVPIILINGKLIGGYTDMKALDEEGKFDSLVFGN